MSLGALVHLLFALLLSAPLPTARAADTTETFDVGALDLEAYAGIAAAGGGEVVVGGGLAPGLSLAASLTSDLTTPTLSGGCLVLFGTPLDTAHVDLDLALATDGSGVAPGAELNLDRRDGLAAWGAYVRAELPYRPGRGTGRLAVTPGAYWTLAGTHQVLVELSRPWGPTGVALGYNVVVSDVFEVITEASLALGTQAGDPGLMAGLIATL